MKVSNSHKKMVNSYHIIQESTGKRMRWPSRVLVMEDLFFQATKIQIWSTQRHSFKHTQLFPISRTQSLRSLSLIFKMTTRKMRFIATWVTYANISTTVKECLWKWCSLSASVLWLLCAKHWLNWRKMFIVRLLKIEMSTKNGREARKLLLTLSWISSRTT